MKKRVLGYKCTEHTHSPTSQCCRPWFSLPLQCHRCGCRLHTGHIHSSNHQTAASPTTKHNIYHGGDKFQSDIDHTIFHESSKHPWGISLEKNTGTKNTDTNLVNLMTDLLKIYNLIIVVISAIIYTNCFIFVLLTQKTAEIKHRIPRREWSIIFKIEIIHYFNTFLHFC